MLGTGLGMLAAGAGLDALLFGLGGNAVLHDSSGESGLALALPPVLAAGGLRMFATGIARSLGADPITALRVGSVTSWLGGALLGAISLLVGLDPDAAVGGFDHEHVAAYLAAHAATSFVLGTTTFVVAF